VAAGDAAALQSALGASLAAPAAPPVGPQPTEALRSAIDDMVLLLDAARTDPVAVVGPGAADWSAAAAAARRRVVRMSLELRLVVSIAS
jgi:hypothetical protein